MNPSSDAGKNGSRIEWLGLITAYGRIILIVALAVAAVVFVAGYVYVRWGQGTQIVASLEFRPTFSGMADLKYPNGLPFSSNDVTAGPIIDLVYDNNNLLQVCDRETFRGAFFVEQRSDQSVFLDMEYQARLTEPRITTVERKLLQEEHAAKRKALPLQYRLVFLTPPTCSGLHPELLSKVMVEVLKTWASESETKRGVLKHQVEVLTPSVLDVSPPGPGGLLLRADLLRTALQRVIDNVTEVGNLPGAVLIRLGPDRITFLEVKGKLSDLVGSRLDPLVMTSGGSMIKESSVWVTETVAAAERREKAAERRAFAYQQALQQFSGTSKGSDAGRAAAAGTGAALPSNNSQALVPQIDGSFIDRIVELSEANARFRQKLTESMVDAELDAGYEEQRASYYRRLLERFRGSGPAGDQTDLEKNLDAIVQEGKQLTKQFGELYDEFSRVALRSAGALYVTEKPVTIARSQRFSNRSVLKLAAASFLITLLLAFGFLAARSRLFVEYR